MQSDNDNDDLYENHTMSCTRCGMCMPWKDGFYGPTDYYCMECRKAERRERYVITKNAPRGDAAMNHLMITLMTKRRKNGEYILNWKEAARIVNEQLDAKQNYRCLVTNLLLCVKPKSLFRCRYDFNHGVFVASLFETLLEEYKIVFVNHVEQCLAFKLLLNVMCDDAVCQSSTLISQVYDEQKFLSICKMLVAQSKVPWRNDLPVIIRKQLMDVQRGMCYRFAHITLTYPVHVYLMTLPSHAQLVVDETSPTGFVLVSHLYNILATRFDDYAEHATEVNNALAALFTPQFEQKQKHPPLKNSGKNIYLKQQPSKQYKKYWEQQIMKDKRFNNTLFIDYCKHTLLDQ